LKPETTDAIAHADAYLVEAVKILEIGIPSVAGRQAYLAALTAARGLVFELRGKGPKTHKGVKAEMHELVRNGLPLDRRHLSIFDSGFELKLEADYGNPEAIGSESARDVIETASALIAQIKEILLARS